MKYLKHSALTLALFSSFAYADAGQQTDSQQKAQAPSGWMYGLGYGYQKEIYKGYDSRSTFIPLIGYQGEKLTVMGPFVSYELGEAGGFTFKGILSPRFDGYDEDDSDVFAGMEEREWSIDGGISASTDFGRWQFEVDAKHDLLGRHEGYELGANIAYPLRYGPVSIKPSFGVSHQSADLVNYYYGVGADEVTDVRGFYDPGSTLNTQVGVDFGMPVWKGFARLSVGHTWYGDEIADSPLVDDDSSFNTMLTYSLSF